MPVDPQLLRQALRTPEEADVTETPIARAVILTDPANAADLVPMLGDDSLEARNARRVLCQFGPDAVAHLLTALAADMSARARSQGAGVLAAMLTSEEPYTVRRNLAEAQASVRTLLTDTRPLPDEMPAYIERDFTGRICDQLYVTIRELLDADFDQSDFRAFDDVERDAEIRQWLSRGLDNTVA